MTTSTRTFRIFVSSTFSDLKAERNALQERVFPKLRELVAEHGHQFQAIDLRWGVSDQASLDQQAMNICLGEIDRCQRSSPRPNFIVLLGDRFGWCPPPSQIPAKEFDKIRKHIKQEDDINLLTEWYTLDENAVPAEYHLEARKKDGEYEDYRKWQPVEHRLQDMLARAATELDFPEDRLLPYRASATEQEIAAGALQVSEAPQHVYSFFREIEGLPAEFNAEKFLKELEDLLNDEYKGGKLPTFVSKYLKKLQQIDLADSAKDINKQIEDWLAETDEDSAERSVLFLMQVWLNEFTGKDFQNLIEEDWTRDEVAAQSQRELKEKLEEHVPGNVFHYQAQWTGQGISTDHIDLLCKDVYQALSGIILEEIEESGKSQPVVNNKPLVRTDEFLDDEGLFNHAFAEERLRFFVGRESILNNIEEYIKGSERCIMAILGKGGTGKSALTAKAIQEAQTKYSSAHIIYRFIGATPSSSNGRSLLDSLCREISRRYSVSESDVPIDYRDLVVDFGQRLALATNDRPLILFLDSLDQLSSQQEARSLSWLPETLPDNAFVIVSTRPEDGLDTRLQSKRAKFLELEGLSEVEGDTLLTMWLGDVKRTLQTSQREEILLKFIESEGAPLYLKLAFGEARLWHSANGEPPEELAPGIKGIIQKNLINRLANESNHGQVMLSQALGYLAASRYGVAEDEMVDLLSRDIEVYQWFMKSSFHLPTDLLKCAVDYLDAHEDKRPGKKRQYEEYKEKLTADWLQQLRDDPDALTEFLDEVLSRPNGPRIPIVLWSRLSFDLEPYLNERSSEGRALLTFYHRELGDVSEEQFLKEGKAALFHSRLANYFHFKTDPDDDGTWSGDTLRGLSELPHHLTQAARYDEVFQTLTDFRFLERKASEVGVIESKDENGKPIRTYSGVIQLQEDFEQALEALPGEGKQVEQTALFVTAVDFGQGKIVVCPWCNTRHPLDRAWLGQSLSCPTCGNLLQVNPFIVSNPLEN